MLVRGLFCELLLNRWVPAVVEVVAYYANLLLNGSFLGLGLGLLLTARRSLIGAFPWLLLLEVLVVLGAGRFDLPSSADEIRYNAVTTGAVQHLTLVAVFRRQHRHLRAARPAHRRAAGAAPAPHGLPWDLAGSLLGTLVFGAFSFLAFSPVVGVIAIGALFPLLASGRRWLRSSAVFALAVAAVVGATPRGAVWSPYHFLRVLPLAGGEPLDAPPPDLRTRTDPPWFTVEVNRSFYQLHGTLDPRRYRQVDPATMRAMDTLPHEVRPGPGRVLVVGSGGGPDVEAALLCGATHVTAIDVDPALTGLSRRWAASGVYEDPRVSADRRQLRDRRLAVPLPAGAHGPVVVIGAATPVRRFGAVEGQAFFMGAGFLLLQTKAIGDCSLYFGATWLVTTAVVAGVLLMVLAANVVTARWPERPGRHAGLLLAVIALALAPREWVLSLPFAGRLAWVVLVVPLPVYFAGRVFSTAFKSAPDPATLFGANLLGAVLGGFSEYLGMITGSRLLGALLVVFYGASFLCARRRGAS